MLVAEPNQPRGVWPLGRIVSTHPGKDWMVPAVTVIYSIQRVQESDHEALSVRGSGRLEL